MLTSKLLVAPTVPQPGWEWFLRGLVGAYPMIQTADHSHNDNPLTLRSGSTWGAGPYGKAIVLDGTSNAGIDIRPTEDSPPEYVLESNEGFAIFALARNNSGTSAFRTLVARPIGGTFDSYYWHWNEGGSGANSMGLWNGNAWYSSGNCPNGDGTWRSYAVHFFDGTVSFIVDGTVRGTVGSAGTAYGQDSVDVSPVIGYRPGDHYTDGAFAAVYMWRENLGGVPTVEHIQKLCADPYGWMRRPLVIPALAPSKIVPVRY